jgi:NAD(P)-dependent dehydrogenase (short-subunit alcohol dehydrogenase family)
MASIPLPGFVSFTKTWHSEPYPFISPLRPELSAAGKNIVITGGGSGIGQAIGIAFAQAGAASVAIIGRRLDRLEIAAKAIRAANGSTEVIYEAGDVTQQESIQKALQKIVQKVGKIDIFCANAGILPTQGLVSGYDEAELRRGLMTNVIGSFNSLQAFLPLAAPGAKLFYTGSGIGHWKPMPEVPGVFGYAAAKAATQKMVDYFASENPHIHVVSIQPGIIATGINPDLTIGFDKGISLCNKAVSKANKVVELPAHFIVWLASEEAKFLKGKFVWANWDAEELLARADEIQTSMLLEVTLNGVDM